MLMATLMDFDVLGTLVPVSPFLHQLKLDGSQDSRVFSVD
jgi:hypothetical protein